MRKIISVLVLTICLISCGGLGDTSGEGNSGGNGCTTDSFDRQAMLENWADNIIIPAYEDYIVEIARMKVKAVTFKDNPSETTLNDLRTEWLTAYRAWQTVAMFQIGEAEIVRLRDYTNTFPTNASKIEGNIASNTYNLILSTQVDAQGFPALDYLLNGLGASDQEILGKYTANDNYKNYLSALIDALLENSKKVRDDWKSTFRVAFIQNNCSSSTASVDKLVNDFIFNFEKRIRVAKVGMPIGFFTSVPEPEKIEGFYKKDISKELLLEALKASKDFFNGKHFGTVTEGQSLKSYLNQLGITAGGKDLSTVIIERIDDAIATAEALDANFQNQIETDRSALVALRGDLHAVVEILKTNMISALSIKADFNDTDGD